MEQQEFMDRMENVLKKTVFYNKAYGFSGLQDESHESETLFKGVLAKKGNSNSKSCRIYKEGKENP